MKNTIICIGRQYGSGGREIGEKLAEQLGVVCYDKLLLQKTAKASGLALETVKSEDEQPVGLSSLVSGNPFADSAFLSQTFYSEELKVAQAEQQTILNLAQKGCCVFIGRCADIVLRDYPNCVNIFLHAEKEYRTERIMKLYDMDKKAALNAINKTDKQRQRYYNAFSDKKWNDVASYDLVLNSGKLGMEKTVQIICDYAKLFQEK